MFSETLKYWTKRKKQFGDRSVGNVAEDRVQQGMMISVELAKVINGTFYTHGLDFGCGYGRLTPYLSVRCGHLWAADIFNDWIERAVVGNNNITPVILDSYVLPFETGTFDFVADIMTVQSINEKDRAIALRELARVTTPGGKIVSLMKGDQQLKQLDVSKLLKLSGATQTNLDHIDKKRDQFCLIVGTRL
jgi:SAM-dependent methyltransferase